MTEEDARNVAALRRAYTLWDEYKGRRCDFWVDMFAESFVIESAAAPHRGIPSGIQLATNRQQLQEYFGTINANWRMVCYTIDTYVAANNHVVARGGSSWVSRRTGRKFSTYKIDWWRFHEGQAVSFFDTFDTYAVLRSLQAD